MDIIKGSQNLAYSWWVHPRVCVEAGTGNILYGGVMTDGRPRIFRKEPADLSYSTVENKILLDPGDADDHNSVAIHSVAGKPLVAFWQRHGVSPYLNWWVAPEGTFNFGAKKRVTFPAGVTYCQVFHIEGDRSIVFVRADGWYFITTDDHFQTVSAPVKFIEGSTGRIYLHLQRSTANPDVLIFAGAQNPASNTGHYIVTGDINLVTGDVGDGSGGVAGNMWSEVNLPLTQTDLFDIQPLVNSAERVRLLDIFEVHGETVIEYAKWGGGLVSQYFQAHLPTPGSAVKQPLGIMTGDEFGPTAPRHYIAGTAIDRTNCDALYVAREAAGVSYLEKYPINTDFTLGVPELIQSNADYRLVRPAPFDGGVMWQELRRYNSYVDYSIHVWIGTD